MVGDLGLVLVWKLRFLHALHAIWPRSFLKKLLSLFPILRVKKKIRIVLIRIP